MNFLKKAFSLQGLRTWLTLRLKLLAISSINRIKGGIISSPLKNAFIPSNQKGSNHAKARLKM
jgi:hypothetical protein